MFIEILKHTPSWVFFLFFGLLLLGYYQSKPRAVHQRRVAILPMAMTALSFYGVFSAFGPVPAALVLWALGVVISVGIGLKLGAPRGVTFSPETQSFDIPGSWLPLALMMAIFFIKYAVGVILARQLPMAGEMAFVASISLCYGLLSGVFLARAIIIRRSAVHLR